MIDPRRRWRWGRRRGPARGLGVFGAPGFATDADGLADLLGRHDALTNLMDAAGAELEVSRAGLHAVDAMTETWRSDLVSARNLTNHLGLFLGDVLIQEIAGAGWHVWPNGHPVIALAAGPEFDVTASAEAWMVSGGPHLSGVLDRAVAASKR